MIDLVPWRVEADVCAALEDLLVAHPEGLPVELVGVHGDDVRACRRLWDSARSRAQG